MANFIKAGKTRVNLDRVLSVEERNVVNPAKSGEFVSGVRVRFGPTDRETLDLAGDDATAFLAAVDPKAAATTK